MGKVSEISWTDATFTASQSDMYAIIDMTAECWKHPTVTTGNLMLAGCGGVILSRFPSPASNDLGGFLMAKWNVGAKNGIWNGGRSVASNGYVLIRVGVDHHLADVRGYAYEHRIVAEQKLGRRLEAGEIVHHVDGDKQNNDPSNLKVVRGNGEHSVHHRSGGSAVRLPGEQNPTVECSCGCGTVFQKFDSQNRVRRFVSGHNRGGKDGRYN